jgi:hypothetical protein
MRLRLALWQEEIGGNGKKTLWVNELNTKTNIMMNEGEANFRKKMFEIY